MTRPRTLVPGQHPDGSWQVPTDLRCVGGPADGQWYAKPPAGYGRREARGGAYWGWVDPAVWDAPLHALPGEAV